MRCELQMITLGPAFIRSFFMNLIYGEEIYNPKTSVGISLRSTTLLKMILYGYTN